MRNFSYILSIKYFVHLGLLYNLIFRFSFQILILFNLSQIQQRSFAKSPSRTYHFTYHEFRNRCLRIISTGGTLNLLAY